MKQLFILNALRQKIADWLQSTNTKPQHIHLTHPIRTNHYPNYPETTPTFSLRNVEDQLVLIDLKVTNNAPITWVKSWELQVIESLKMPTPSFVLSKQNIRENTKELQEEKNKIISYAGAGESKQG